jgi:SAM-dependent methyltransferase
VEPFLDFVGAADGQRVLDLGCGTGSLTFALARRADVRSIYGLDYSAAYVDYANRRNSDTRIKFLAGDACAIPFANGAFDEVLSVLMLHFVPQAEQAVTEMRRVARSGAVVAATVWDARGGFMANRIYWDTAALLDPKADELRARNYTRPMCRSGELANAWRAARLKDICQTTLTIRMDFESFDDFWAPYLSRQGPAADYVASLDAARQTTLRHHVRRAYLDGDLDGARSYAASAWAIRGIAPA